MTYWLALLFPPLAVMDAGRRAEACVSAVMFTPVVWWWLNIALGGWLGLFVWLPLAGPCWVLCAVHAALVLVGEGRKNRLTESKAVARGQEPCQVALEKVSEAKKNKLTSAAKHAGPDERGVWVID